MDFLLNLLIIFLSLIGGIFLISVVSAVWQRRKKGKCNCKDEKVERKLEQLLKK